MEEEEKKSKYELEYKERFFVSFEKVRGAFKGRERSISDIMLK